MRNHGYLLAALVALSVAACSVTDRVTAPDLRNAPNAPRRDETGGFVGSGSRNGATADPAPAATQPPA
jgi:hypothetical protein